MLAYKKNPKFHSSIITPEWAHLRRRHLLKGGALGLLAWWAQWSLAQLKFNKNAKHVVEDKSRPITKKELALSYNNFYEFSLDKNEPAKLAKDWKIDQWNLAVSGLLKKPLTLKLKDLYEMFPLEERVYRFRCVEAWSMVLPWVGFPLAALLDKVEPKSEAKYVRFTTLADPKVMPNINKLPGYPWPYTEGLTLEEARHPLTFMAVGLYGEALKGQNGAPIRLVVPWKYGFKSIKSVVKIELVAEQPKTLWHTQAPNEYGFYANVNPKVSHPRWSQASERIIDGALFPKRTPSLMFNGYENEVKDLYAGLDLTKNF